MQNCWLRSFFPGIVTILVLCFFGKAQAQTTIFVQTIPEYTPEEDTLYLVGNFNDWNPNDPHYQLKKREDGIFWLNCSALPKPLEFKITRGDWERVEGSKWGQTIENRIYNQQSYRDTLRVEVLSWEDLAHHIPFDKKIKIKVNSIPASTPDDASIYIAGSFNEWNPRDKKYKLEKESADHYAVWIPVREDTVQYKFTRGNWSSIEGGRNGRARHNRVFISGKEKVDLVQAKIETWEDLSGNPINMYTFLLLLAAFQGILLIIAINTIQDNNESANRILSVLILLICIALIGRVSTYGREIFQWQPKLLGTEKK